MKNTLYYELYVGSSESENGGKSAFLKTNKLVEEELNPEQMILEYAFIENVITEEEMNDINSGSGFLIPIEESDIDEGCEFIKI